MSKLPKTANIKCLTTFQSVYVFKNDCPTQKVFAKLVSFDKSIISKAVNFCIFQV